MRGPTHRCRGSRSGRLRCLPRGPRKPVTARVEAAF
jgi:hypothetical protein